MRKRKNAVLRDWIIRLVADGFTEDERVLFAKTFVDALWEYCVIEAKLDMPFKVIGNVYGEPGFKNGTRVETSIVERIVREKDGHFFVETSSGSKYYVSINEMAWEMRAMRGAFVPDGMSVEECFAL